MFFRDNDIFYPEDLVQLRISQPLVIFWHSTYGALTLSEKQLLIKICSAIGKSFEEQHCLGPCDDLPNNHRHLFELGKIFSGSHLAIHHPRELIQNPSLKRETWDALKLWANKQPK